MASIEEYMRKLSSVGASELVLCSARPPLYRALDQLLPLPGEGILGDAELRALLQSLVSADDWARLQNEHALQFAAEPASGQRVCGLCSLGYAGLTARLRVLRSADELNTQSQLPAALADLHETQSGLVVVTGPAGSGKTTLLATWVALIASARDVSIVSCEDPVEYAQQSRAGQVSQRSLGRDCESFARALDVAIDADADVIVCSNMLADGALERMVEAACAGLLVLSELRGAGAVNAVEQLLAREKSARRAQLAAELAECLHAVVSLDLLPKKSGGRLLASEVLLATPNVCSLLRDGKIGMLYSLLDREPGMQSMDRCLLDLALRGLIEGREAYARAQDKRAFAAWG